MRCVTVTVRVLGVRGLGFGHGVISTITITSIFTDIRNIIKIVHYNFLVIITGI